MARFRNYDPNNYSVVFRGILFQGYAEGTFISVERDEDTFTKAIGSQGDATRVRSHNRGGKVTVTLQASSPTNDLLSALMIEDERDGGAYGDLLMKDSNGLTAASAEAAWIMRVPNVERSKEGTDSIEWVIDAGELEVFIGGFLT